MVKIRSGLTLTILPTNPISSPFGIFFSHMSISPSLPHRPAAVIPCFCKSCTILLLTFPARTISTILTVSSSVTRRPPRNSDFLPILSNIWLISGPPPWTITGFIPTSFIRAMSSMTDALMVSLIIAAPPYLMTTTAPANSLMYGMASTRVVAFSR